MKYQVLLVALSLHLSQAQMIDSGNNHLQMDYSSKLTQQLDSRGQIPQSNALQDEEFECDDDLDDYDFELECEDQVMDPSQLNPDEWECEDIEQDYECTEEPGMSFDIVL